MNNYPEYAEVNGKQYKINTDFRVAIRCDEVAQDLSITNIERGLAIVYLLFGEEGLDNENDINELLEIGMKFLLCGKEYKQEKREEPKDMDFIQDMDYIEASFMSDYRIDLTTTNMHWWKFINLIKGLSNSDMGNCCILNRVRSIRNFNLNTIKDPVQKEKMRKAKEQFALKQNKKVASAKQKESARQFYEKILKRSDTNES